MKNKLIGLFFILCLASCSPDNTPTSHRTYHVDCFNGGVKVYSGNVEPYYGDGFLKEGLRWKDTDTGEEIFKFPGDCIWKLIDKKSGV